jgi:hypothetical protein
VHGEILDGIVEALTPAGLDDRAELAGIHL